MPSWKKVILSGSDASLNSLTSATYISASTFSGTFTGSLQGTSSWATSASYALSSSYAVTASYAVTSSYGLNPYISGSLNNVSAIYFNTSSAPPIATAALQWDSGEGTLQLGLTGSNVALNVGESIYQYVYNAQGTTLTKGQVVYASGSQGGRLAAKLASAAAELGSANTLGLVAETIAAGGQGWIITEGTLKNVDTSAFTAGYLVYLSSSAGQYTPNIPLAPLHSVRLGIVQKVDASTGAIYVKIDNGYETNELHDVLETNIATGDLFVRSGSVWINSKQLTGSYALTGSLEATSFTGSLLGTASFAAKTQEYTTFAVSDEYAVLTTGISKITFRSPYAITLTQIPRASLSVSSSSGNVVADINVNGSSILGVNKLSIDVNEKTSTTAATPTTIASPSIADDAEITVDVDSAGTGATGLKITLYYIRD